MQNQIRQRLDLRPGELVRVKAFREILPSLNEQGTLDLLPFMPEMREYCGKTYRVYKRAEKTCVELEGVRGMANAVLLEDVRCNGAAHDGCQRACLIFWKEAWLERVTNSDLRQPDQRYQNGNGLERLKTKVDAETYFCQSTELARATHDLPWWRMSQYFNDYRYGQISLGQVVRTLSIVLYNKVMRTFGQPEYGMIRGTLSKTPDVDLRLQPGDIVEVRGKDEIAATLNETGRNRGLEFSPEMHTFCGGKFRVAQPLEKMIMEGTGKMVRLTNTVLLEGTSCDGSSHRGCPRNNLFMWREIWLQRADRQGGSQPGETPK